jgi:SAM-dependent methyltransferase
VIAGRMFRELFRSKPAAKALGDRVEGPLKLHLGCGRTILPGWVNVDIQRNDGVDVVADFDRCSTTPLPFPDDSVIEIQAFHLIEHLSNPLPFMQELHRVARAGAKAVFRCPYGSSNDAFEDPTHVRQYFPGSFAYFGQPAYQNADYGYRGDWQIVLVVLALPRDRFQGRPYDEIWNDVMSLNNVVREMHVELQAIKPIRPQRFELMKTFPTQFSFVD